MFKLPHLNSIRLATILIVLSTTPVMASSTYAHISQYIPPFTVWVESATRNNLPPSLIYGLALVESGKYTSDKKFVPWPFAIGVGKDLSVGQLHHQSYYPSSFEEAEMILNDLLGKGYTNIGLGIMQVNIRENPHLFEDPVHLFDPVTNIRAASKVIRQCNSDKTFVQMLSCYSHGRYNSEKGALYAHKVFKFQRDYGQRFVNLHQPSGEMTLAELNYIYFNNSFSFNSTTDSVEIVE